MAQQVYACPKCGGDMRRGFLAERGEHSTFVAKWIDGEPVNAEIFGIRGQNVNIQNRNSFQVRSLRCDLCGFLELYAV
jgi:predicted nucleic-acid-binding Zn-ribbon protein